MLFLPLLLVVGLYPLHLRGVACERSVRMKITIFSSDHNSPFHSFCLFRNSWYNRKFTRTIKLGREIFLYCKELFMLVLLFKWRRCEAQWMGKKLSGDLSKWERSEAQIAEHHKESIICRNIFTSYMRCCGNGRGKKMLTLFTPCAPSNPSSFALPSPLSLMLA